MNLRISIALAVSAVLIAAGALWLSRQESHPRENEEGSSAQEFREAPADRAEAAPSTAEARTPAEASADSEQDTAVEVVPAETGVAPATGSAVVAGRVLIAGRQPEESLTLALVDRADSVLLRLGAVYVFGSEEASKATTDEDGRFVFGGLAEDWTGSVQLPAGYTLRTRAGEPRTTHIGLAGPTDDVLIDLALPLAITGRALSRDDSEPVEGATIFAMIESGDGLERSETVSGRDGRFTLRRSSAEVDRLTLFAAHEERLLFGKSEIERPTTRADRDGDVEVGAIYLSHVGTSGLYVADRRGRPVADAHAIGIPPTIAFGPLTDEQGYAQMVVPVDEGGTLAVKRDGFWTQLFNLPPDGADAHLVLDKANRIEVLVESETGTALPPGYTVSVQADHQLDAGWDIRSSLWISLSSKQGVPLHPGLSAETDRDGRAVVEGIWPGRPFSIEVADLGGASVAREPLPPLGRSQALQHRIVVPEAARVIEGVVVDDGRNPIEGASILVLDTAGSGADEGHEREATTGAKGEFRIEGLYEEQVSLQVQHEEFVCALVEGVPTGEGAVTVRLKMGNRVVVHVADADGSPITGLFISVALGEMGPCGRASAEELGSGLYLLSGLAPGQIEINAHLDGTRVAIRHDSSISRAEIVVRALGSLTVEWELPPELDPEDEDGSGKLFYLVLAPTDSQREHLRFILFTMGNPTGVETFDHVPAGEYWADLHIDHPDQIGLKQRISQPVLTVVEPRSTNRLRLGP